MFRRCVCYDADERLCYRSPFMDYPERYLQEFNRRHYQEKARFSPEEVLAAADMRAPQPPRNMKSAEMQRLVEPLFSSTEEMQAWIGHVWMFANNDLQVLETLSAIMDTKSMTREEVQRSFTLMVEWVNHFPRWILQGNTSHAIFELQEKQKPPINPGLNLQKAGIRNSQKDINRMWEGNIRKVGRNDPCPCGSGKKYKHCCGTT